MSSVLQEDNTQLNWLAVDDAITRDFSGVSEAYKRILDAYDELLAAGDALSKSGVREYIALRVGSDTISSREELQKVIKQECWAYVLKKMHVTDVMSHKRWLKFEDIFHGNDVDNELAKFPDLTPDNIRDVIAGYALSVVDFFKESVREEWLYWTPKRDTYVTNQDRWKVSNKVIMQRAASSHSFTMFHANETFDRHFRNLGLIFQIMDGVPIPQADKNLTTQFDSKPFGTYDTKYFKVKTFKNGNVHLHIKDQHLLDKFNLLGAGEDCGLPNPQGKEYTPVVDPFDEIQEDTLEKFTGASLDFYPTPPGVAAMMYDHVSVVFPGRNDLVMLEPSAGVGDLILSKRICDTGIARVLAMEVDEERAKVADKKISSVLYYDSSCECRDFLKAKPLPFADVILMNPPFSSYRYVYHVTHAAKFLRQEGLLVAVIPPTWLTGSLGILKKFSDWVHQHEDWTWQINPAKAFSEAGTNVSTGILTLRRGGVQRSAIQMEGGSSANITHQ